MNIRGNRYVGGWQGGGAAVCFLAIITGGVLFLFQLSCAWYV
jgi:hypothetical protein